MTEPHEPAPVLLDVKQVAAMLACSARHVYRLCDGERMPHPVRLGALVRWNRAVIEKWIADGCPNCREAAPSRRRQGTEHAR